VLVAPDKAATARKLGPIAEREVFGRHVFLYEDLRREDLNGLGEYHVPSIADLFVAKMREGAPA
jgi:ABC-2 type transport system ATP-binding protein